MDFEKISKQTYSFCFRLLRVFSIWWGLLLGEELSNGKAKIIDIAMKYVYDILSERFFRTFTRFHGILPSEAKARWKCQNTYSSVYKINLNGKSKMDYRIETRATSCSIKRYNEIAHKFGMWFYFYVCEKILFLVLVTCILCN